MKQLNMKHLNMKSPTTNPAAETPQPETMLTPEAVVEQLRAIRSQISEATPITAKQRRELRFLAATPH